MAEEKAQLKPNYDLPRTKCPFYGFHSELGIFMDNGKNQCPLITDSYAPCEMETAGKAPEWSACSINNESAKKILDKIVDSARIAPKEFWPKGANSWEGMPFKDWMNYILNYKQKTENEKKEDIETKLLVELGTDGNFKYVL